MSRADDDLERELRTHLEIEAEAQRQAGLDAAAAERAAHRIFGSTIRSKEEVRALSIRASVDALGRDMRFGLRMLRRDRSFTFGVGITLALAVGASTALFTLIRNVVLRPLPIAEPDRVVLVYNSYPKAGIEHVGAGGSDYVDRLAEVDTLEDQALFTGVNPSLDAGAGVERVHGLQVTASFFRLMRVPPQHGRPLFADDEAAGRNRVVVLSAGLAERLFGAADAAGRTLSLNGEPHTVVGIMPASFRIIDARAQLWLPLTLTAHDKEHSHANNWTYVARLRPDATLARAQKQVDAVNAANLERYPDTRQVVVDTGFHSVVVRLQDDLVRDVAPTLTLLWAGAFFIMLIGALNIASLVHARSRARGRELATRLALGAGRARVGRQLIVEHVLLSLPAAVVGLVLATAALQLIGGLNLEHLPADAELQVDGAIVAYAFAAAMLVGVALGAVPAIQGLPTNPIDVMRGETRAVTTIYGRLTRAAAVVLQVSAAFVLLVGAGLLLTSFRRAARADLGFIPDGVLTASINLPAARYPNPAALGAFTERALAEVRAIPGVRSAGLTSSIPLGNDYGMRMIFAEGYRLAPGESLVGSYRSSVTDGYFETLRARLVSGRLFDQRDHAGAPGAIVIDVKLARRFWPGQDAVGRRMYFPRRTDLYTIASDTPTFTVVGIVDDLKLRGVGDLMESIGSFYRPFAQAPERAVTFAIHAAAAPTSLVEPLRAAIARVDPQLPLYDVRTMPERVDEALKPRRLPAAVATAFGGVALSLSVVGIYGVLAFLLAQRTREIAIRIALGCTPAEAFGLILREGTALVGCGLALGLAGSWLLGRNLERHLFGVRPLDPAILAVAITILGIAGLAACVVPARRAAHVDPVARLAE